jgi:dsDNA-specific endonuclease/ATPase MutS2
MSKEQDIEEIVHQLQGLQIEQSILLQRLQWLTESSNNSVPLNATRVFVIGDKVRIKNPGPSQANKGKIVKIGINTNRTAVQVKNGTKIVRA